MEFWWWTSLKEVYLSDLKKKNFEESIILTAVNSIDLKPQFKPPEPYGTLLIFSTNSAEFQVSSAKHQLGKTMSTNSAKGQIT